MPKIKDLLQSGLREGTERVWAQFCTSTQEGSSEEYGGDKIEAGAQRISNRAVQTVRDAGDAAKDEAVKRIKNRSVHIRRREETPADDMHFTDNSPNASEQLTPETLSEDKPERPSNTTPEPSSTDRAPRQRLEAGERIKTKGTCISTYDAPAPKEAPMEPKSVRPPAQSSVQAPDRPTGSADAPFAKPAWADLPAHPVRFSSSNPAPSALSAPSRISTANQPARRVGRQSVKTLERGAVKTARKRAVKSAGRTAKTTVKTAQKGVKTVNRTVRTTAKAIQRAAQSAARMAKAASKGAVTAAKAIAKATAAVIKALVAAVKALVAAIAAGGWVALVIILAIALVAAILCLCFGVFASNEGVDRPMTAAIQEIDAEFRKGISRQVMSLSAGDYDKITVQYTGYTDGDADYYINWNDVIAVYAVRVTMDESDPADVVEVTPEKIQRLRETFFAMNTVKYETRVVETEGAGAQAGDGNIAEAELYRELIITVTVNSMDHLAGAALYKFTKNQTEALAAMMGPQMLPLYAQLTGVDLTGGYEGSISDFTAHLSPQTKSGAVTAAALSCLGTAYSAMDCSELTQYAYGQAGISLPRTSVEQAKYCYNNGYAIPRSQLQPGDLIFWSKTTCDCGRLNEIHHVGVYVGAGKIVDASSAKGYVVLRDLWSNSIWQIVLYARPQG